MVSFVSCLELFNARKIKPESIKWRVRRKIEREKKKLYTYLFCNFIYTSINIHSKMYDKKCGSKYTTISEQWCRFYTLSVLTWGIRFWGYRYHICFTFGQANSTNILNAFNSANPCKFKQNTYVYYYYYLKYYFYYAVNNSFKNS